MLFGVAIEGSSQAGMNVWTRSGPEGGLVQALAVDPSQAPTVYAGTVQDGFFKSIDGGGTWTRVGTPLPSGATTIAVEPMNGRRIYVDQGALGTFVSADGGGSWTYTAATLVNALDYAPHPTMSGTAYVGVLDGVRVTMDGGLHWSDFSDGIPSGTRVNALAVTPSGDELYAGTGRQAVLKRTLLVPGSAWTPAAGGLSSDEWVSDLVIHPAAPSTLYAATLSGVFKTVDGGTSWVPANGTLPTGGLNRLVIDPGSPATLYAALEVGGVYKTVDGGTTWTPVGGGVPECVSSIAIAPTTPSTLYVGSSDGRGVYKTTNAGTTWSPVNTGFVGTRIRSLASDPSGTLYAGAGGRVFKSLTAGASWTDASVGLPSCLFVQALALAESTPSTLYLATSQGVFSTSNAAASWSQTALAVPATSLAVHPTDAQIVYAGGSSGNLLRTLDGGGVWTPVVSPFPSNAVLSSVAIDPLVPSTLYVGTLAPATIFGSVNNGASWSLITPPGIPGNSDILTIVIDPHPPETLYVSVSGVGIFRSNDGGTSWIPTALPALEQLDNMLFVDDTGALYGGSYDIFRSVDGGDHWSQVGPGFDNQFVTSIAVDVASHRIHAGAFGGVYDIELAPTATTTSTSTTTTSTSTTTTTSSQGPRCGNRLLEEGEECDDGNTQDGDCCSHDCKIEPADTVCRPSAGPCDLPETCGGSASCPSDQKFQGQCRANPGGVSVRDAVCYKEAFCDGVHDECPSNPVDDGAACNTGDGCTVKDFCQSGTCFPGPRVCTVTVPQEVLLGKQSPVIPVSCSVAGGGTCAAQAFVSADVSSRLEALISPTTSSRRVHRATCRGPQNGLCPITKRVRARLGAGGGRVLTLRLNALGKRLLRGAGSQVSSEVNVEVSPNQGQHLVLQRLIELLRRSP
jgi:cysteine-rich repeat protein